MAELQTCWCDKSSEPCTRLATQEDMRCDVCRRGCATIAAATRTGMHTFPADASQMRLVGAHVEIEDWNVKHE